MIRKTYRLIKSNDSKEYNLSDEQGNIVKLGTKDLEKATKRAKRYMNLLPKINFQ